MFRSRVADEERAKEEDANINSARGSLECCFVPIGLGVFDFFGT